MTRLCSRQFRPSAVRYVMTSRDHATGTDRVAEVARTLDAEIIVNIQGDEPLLPPDAIEKAIRPLLAG